MIIKSIFILCGLFFSNIVFGAGSWSINSSLLDKRFALSYGKVGESEIEVVVDDVLRRSNNLWSNKISFVRVTLSVDDIKESISYTYLKNGSCNIDIAFNGNLKPVLMSTFKNDVSFTLLHELAHCVLGQDIFNNKYVWKTKISEEKKIELDEKIKKLSFISLITKNGCDGCSITARDFIFPLPMLVYHETFSDVLASVWWVKMGFDIKEIENLIDFRKQNFYNQDSQKIYYSHSVLKNILMNINDIEANKNDVDLAVLLTEGAFVEYMDAFDMKEIDKIQKNIMEKTRRVK